jgi:AcrR family transcriptional regulator
MSISYVESGRRNQKARTLAALVAAARELLAAGVTPTVEAAAEVAAVSRATAYRYFPNQQALLVAAHPEVEAASLLGPDPPSDVEARLDRVVTSLVDIFLGAEQSYRAMLRLSLEEDIADRGELALRKGRRYLWIRDALEPVLTRMPAADLDRLVNAISVAVGIEALITLVDLAQVSREQAVQVMRWSARALLRTALTEVREGGGAARSSGS